MGIGFEFRETMSGSYHLLSDPTRDRAIRFTVSVKVDGMRRFVRDKNATIKGTITAEGLATEKSLTGTLGLKLLDEQRLPYEFTFMGDDGKIYRFRGQKDFTVVAVVDSMTVLPASLYDMDGSEVARATLRFDLRGDIWKFLRSWKLRIAYPTISVAKG